MIFSIDTEKAIDKFNIHSWRDMNEEEETRPRLRINQVRMTYMAKSQFCLQSSWKLINRRPLFSTKKYAAAAKSLQSCPTLCDPIDGSPPGSPVPGILQAKHWSGLPFPSPVHESEKWNWSRSVVSDSLRPHGLQPTRLPRPWDFPGKSTGVGCHRLLRKPFIWYVILNTYVKLH